MMNALALGLVLTSLVTAGFFSPNPENHGPKQEDVIVKEGHRVVVVEFEKDDGNTKVSISPQDSHEKGYVANAKEKLSEKMEDMKEKMKETASSVLPETGEVEEEFQHHRFSPRELVCDAYGKCKHKLASAIGKSKEAVVEKAHEAEEAVEEAFGKVKDTVADTARKASDKAHEAKESVGEKAHEMKGKAGEVSETAGEMKEKAKGMKEEAERYASEKMEGTKEKTMEKAEEVKKEGKNLFGEILRRARRFSGGVLGYMVSPERLSPVMGVLHLMGFAAAYGMCVWVTFASSYVLAGALPRHQFAMVQSKIYPVYFKAMAYCIGLAMLGQLLGRRKGRLAFPDLDLLASLGMVLFNMMYLEPRATKVMFERMKKEKEEGRGKEGIGTEPISGERAGVSPGSKEAGGSATATTTTTTTTGGTTQEKPEAEGAVAARSQIVKLSEMLRRLNSYSSLLNFLTLMLLTWHLVRLGQCLHAAAC